MANHMNSMSHVGVFLYREITQHSKQHSLPFYGDASNIPQKLKTMHQPAGQPIHQFN